MATVGSYPKSTIQTKVNIGGCSSVVSSPTKSYTSSVSTSKSGISPTSKTTTTKTTVSSGTAVTAPVTNTSRATQSTSVRTPSTGCVTTSVPSQSAIQQASQGAASHFNSLKNQVNSIDLGGNLNNNNTGSRATAQVTHITSNLNTQTQSLDLSQRSGARTTGCYATPISGSSVTNPNISINPTQNTVVRPTQPTSTVTPTLNVGGSRSSVGGSTPYVNVQPISTGQNNSVRPTPSYGSSTPGITGCNPYINVQPINTSQNSGVNPYIYGSRSFAGGCTATSPIIGGGYTNINYGQNNGVRPSTNYGCFTAGVTGSNAYINDPKINTSQNSGVNPYSYGSRPSINIGVGGSSSYVGVQPINTSQNSGIRGDQSGCYATKVSGNNGSVISPNNKTIDPTQNYSVRPSQSGCASATPNVGGSYVTNTPQVNLTQNSGVRSAQNGSTSAVSPNVSGSNAAVSKGIDPTQNSSVRPSQSGCASATTPNVGGSYVTNTPQVNLTQNSGVRSAQNGSTSAVSPNVSGSNAVVNKGIDPTQNSSVRPSQSGSASAVSPTTSGSTATAFPKVDLNQNSGVRSGQSGSTSAVSPSTGGSTATVFPKVDLTQNSGIKNGQSGSTSAVSPTTSGSTATAFPKVDLNQNSGVRSSQSGSTSAVLPGNTNTGSNSSVVVNTTQNSSVRPGQSGCFAQGPVNIVDEEKAPSTPEFKAGDTGEIKNANDIDFNRIARSADKVQQENFMGREHVWDEYWGDDGQLTYKVRDDGTILIYEGDVAMGYTDAEGLKKLQTTGTADIKTPTGTVINVSGTFATHNPYMTQTTNSGCMSQFANTNTNVVDDNANKEPEKTKKPEFKPGESGNLEHDDIDYSRINRSEDKVAQGKFMERDRIWDDQWGDDGQLRYEVKEDGSILIYEGDVAMGWTDKEGLRALQTNGTGEIKGLGGGTRRISYGSNAAPSISYGSASAVSSSNTDVLSSNYGVRGDAGINSKSDTFVPSHYKVNSENIINKVTDGPDGKKTVTLADGTVKYMTDSEISQFKPERIDGAYQVNSEVVINRVSDLGPDGRRQVYLSNGTTQRLTEEQIYDLNKYGYYGKPIDNITTSISNGKIGDPVNPQPGIYTINYKDGSSESKFMSSSDLDSLSKMSSYSVTKSSGLGVKHERIYVDPLKLDEKVQNYNADNSWQAANIRRYEPVPKWNPQNVLAEGVTNPEQVLKDLRNAS